MIKNLLILYQFYTIRNTHNRCKYKISSVKKVETFIEILIKVIGKTSIVELWSKIFT